MEAKENYNLKKVGEGIALEDRRAGCRDVIVGIRSFEGKIYLLSHVPRLEITEMDEEGTITATYWMDSQEVYETHDFLIREIDGVKKFYVSHSHPPKYDIDVFGVKTRIAQEGLPGEIADLTEEIAANPDFYLAYNNRGVARYRLEDYQGAIEDFSRAIEDFKKAADLDPEMEKKAREQIGYCLSQLKKHFTGSSLLSWRITQDENAPLHGRALWGFL
jgi:tetratricopeptide (TPR) repeat protein